MSRRPEALQFIYEVAQSHALVPSTLPPRWAEHVKRAQDLVPGVQVVDGGEALYTGELSPGCAACKAGTWDCVFTTLRCNLNCGFCINPHSLPVDYAGSGFGDNPAEITANYPHTQIDGISFSGGDPFTEPDKLFTWIEAFKAAHSTAYYWLYTNGLLAEEAYLKRLGELGIDEIRFNMAASDYTHPTVLKNLSTARQYIPNLTVEIPAIPAHADRLMKGLHAWVERGVRFLNLHELTYEPGTNAENLAGDRLNVIMPDGHETIIDPKSRELTLKVMRYVQEQGLSLSVNDCSLHSKHRQLRERRRGLAPLTQLPHEALTDDGLFITHCAYQGDEVLAFHPDHTAAMRDRLPGYVFVRVGRRTPLAIHEDDGWVLYEALS